MGLKWKDIDPYEVEKPLRTAIRDQIPRWGRVFTDLDLVARRYTDANPVGWFRLIETKSHNANLTRGQLNTFRQIDRVCRSGDPDGSEYLGFYVVRPSNTEYEPGSLVQVNRLFEDQWHALWPVERFLQWLDMQVPGPQSEPGT